MSDQNLLTSPIRLHSDEEAEIATLAYRFYCEEGCPEGKANAHWMRAEREIRGRPKAVESTPPESESESVPAARSENPPVEE